MSGPRSRFDDTMDGLYAAPLGKSGSRYHVELTWSPDCREDWCFDTATGRWRARWLHDGAWHGMATDDVPWVVKACVRMQEEPT